MSKLDQKLLDKKDVQFLLYGNQHPVIISFVDTHNQLVSTPVWCYYQQGKFYLFSSKKSMKVRTIEKGNTQFTLMIINKDAFVVVKSEDLPYISMTGTMRIVTQEDITSINEIHIRLLQKYNPPEQESWVQDIIDRLKTNPTDTWMLEFTPENFRTY